MRTVHQQVGTMTVDGDSRRRRRSIERTQLTKEYCRHSARHALISGNYVREPGGRQVILNKTSTWPLHDY